MSVWRLRGKTRGARDCARRVFRFEPPLCALLFCALLSGCGEGAGPAGTDGSLSIVPITPPPSDGLLTSPELQRVVELQLRRDGAALLALLASPDAAVRGRAALALATVQDPEGVEPLYSLLADPAAPVRANAAFALGHLVLPDGGARLIDVLEVESDGEVRARLLQALGRRGASGAIDRLTSMPPEVEDEGAWTLALAEAGRRGVRSGGLLGALSDRLTHAEAEIRLAAASYFGQTQTAGRWILEAGRLRAALDGYRPEDPAAVHLVVALAKLGNDGQDLDRIVGWMTGSPDWRTRAGAALAVGTEAPWRGHPVVSHALWSLLDDPSGPVRSAAASVLPVQLYTTPEVLDQMAAWVADSTRDWRTQTPFLSDLIAAGRVEVVVEWTRGALGRHPFAAIRGVEVLPLVAGEGVTELLVGLAAHEDALIRGTALRAMATRWLQLGEGDETFDRYLALFQKHLGDAANLPAAWSARALSDPILVELGVEAWLVDAFHERRETGDPNILVPLVIGFGASAEPLLRELASGADPLLSYVARLTLARLTAEPIPPLEGPLTAPFRTVDWTALAAAGPAPRVHLETEQGRIVVRLFPEQAPLTVQLFLEQVATGMHDGVAFHRVLPGLLLQGGDFAMGDGTGRTPYGVRTEITQLPARRGVVGMASSGTDTEGSQFFILQADHVSLDGNYTAFGWIEAGVEVVDRLMEGDRVLRAWVD